MDNIQKVLLGVLGSAGVITFMATTLNTPRIAETPAVSVATPASLPPPPIAVEPEIIADEEVVVSEDEFPSEDIDSYGEPTVDLPSDETEDQAGVNSNEQADAASSSGDQGPQPSLPPPPPPRAI